MASHAKQLVVAVDRIKLVLPCETSRNSLRAFRSWQANDRVPVHVLVNVTFSESVEAAPIRRRAAVVTRLMSAAKILAALLAALGNLTAQLIQLLTV